MHDRIQRVCTASLERLSLLVTDFLLAQVESGADAVQLFDTWAGNLSADDYRRFALPYTQTIIEKVRKTGKPTILYVNGSHHLLPLMGESGADVLSVDWRTSLETARKRLDAHKAVQGNLDPTALFGNTDKVFQRTRRMIESWSGNSGYIANLGHGILPKTPVENATAFVQAVKMGW